MAEQGKAIVPAWGRADEAFEQARRVLARADEEAQRERAEILASILAPQANLAASKIFEGLGAQLGLAEVNSVLDSLRMDLDLAGPARKLLDGLGLNLEGPVWADLLGPTIKVPALDIMRLGPAEQRPQPAQRPQAPAIVHREPPAEPASALLQRVEAEIKAGRLSPGQLSELLARIQFGEEEKIPHAGKPDLQEEALMIFEHWQRNKHAKTQEGCAMEWPEISFATWRLRVKAGEKLSLLMRAGKLSRKFSN